MRIRHMLTCCVLLSLVVAASIRGTAQADDLPVTQVSFYQGINLTSGQKEFVPDVLTLLVNPSERVKWVLSPDTEEELFRFSEDVDLYFGYDPASPQPIRVTPVHLSGLAVLPETDVETVDDETVRHLPLTTPPAAVAVGGGDTIVARTVDGRMVVFGRVRRQPDWTITFAARILPPESIPTPIPTATPSVPEPSTLLLFGVGFLGLIGIMRRRITYHKSTYTQGGRSMSRILFFLIAGFWLPLIVNAAELTVTIQGCGNGTVIGEHIYCEEDCTATYPEETMVHLTATPDEYSQFMGWLVDGVPHTGTLVIKKDTHVTAMFDEVPQQTKALDILPPKPFLPAIPPDAEGAFFLFSDSRKEFAGYLQRTRAHAGADGALMPTEQRVLLNDGPKFFVEPLDNVIVSRDRTRVMVFGGYLDDLEMSSSGMVIIYSGTGELIARVNTRMGWDYQSPPFVMEDDGTFWMVGRTQEAFMLKKYSRDGDLLSEETFSQELRRLSLSLDQRSLVVLPRDDFSTGFADMRVYSSAGTLISTHRIPGYFNEVEFVADDTVLLYETRYWELHRLEPFDPPIATGQFRGASYEIIPVPEVHSVFVSTFDQSGCTKGMRIQAINNRTGELLAEGFLSHDGDSQEFPFIRRTSHDSIELWDGNTLIELRIPK